MCEGPGQGPDGIGTAPLVLEDADLSGRVRQEEPLELHGVEPAVDGVTQVGARVGGTVVGGPVQAVQQSFDRVADEEEDPCLGGRVGKQTGSPRQVQAVR